MRLSSCSILSSFFFLLVCSRRIRAQDPQQPQDTDPLSKVPYLTHVQCGHSDIIQGTNASSIELTPDLSFHWKHGGEQQPGLFIGALHYTGGKAWLGLGFSKDGTMVGSKAIIGMPGDHPQCYNLNSEDASLAGIVPNPGLKRRWSLHGWTHTDTDDLLDATFSTTLRFNIHRFYKELDGMHDEGVVNFIYAVGTNDQALGLHQHRGSFRLDVSSCPVQPDPLLGQADTATSTGDAAAVAAASPAAASGSSSYDHKAAFVAHGFFATLAFCVLTPLAITVAWFRALIPKWWIYIHVLANTSAAFFTTISVACAFGGMVMRGKEASNGQLAGPPPSTHMSIAHHWVGLVLLILVASQVINGFRRPAVQAKTDPSQLYEDQLPQIEGKKRRRYCCLCIPVIETMRDKWHALHVVTALFVLILAICNVQSGFRLFTSQYGGNTTAILAVFWVWIAALVVGLTCVKCILKGRHNKTRSSSSPKNLMPRCREEDVDEEDMDTTRRSISSSATDTEELNNMII